jgi:hypothetical protein
MMENQYCWRVMGLEAGRSLTHCAAVNSTKFSPLFELAVYFLKLFLGSNTFSSPLVYDAQHRSVSWMLLKRTTKSPAF